MKWLIIIGFNQVLVALILFIRSNLSALLLFKKDSILSITDRLILIFFCGYFLYSIANNAIITIDFFILSQTVAYLITVFIGFSLVCIDMHCCAVLCIAFHCVPLLSIFSATFVTPHR